MTLSDSWGNASQMASSSKTVRRISVSGLQDKETESNRNHKCPEDEK